MLYGFNRNSQKSKRVVHQLFSSFLIVAFTHATVLPAYAQTVTPDPASPSNRPSIDQSANGVPVINIVRPNSAGVSHNNFTQYNVGPQGQILNNSPTLGTSTLGGIIQGNPNLQGGPSATLVINEVTGVDISRIEGAVEMFGSAADLVIANPNGITINGGTFINIPNATLTTGRPVLDETGALSAIEVDRGAIEIAGLGLDASSASRVDVLARSLALNADFHGQDINVFTGRFDFDIASRNIAIKPENGVAKPVFLLDSSALGGMFADRIRLIGTEEGVGVNSQGSMIASSGDLFIEGRGDITLAELSAARNTDIRSVDGSVTIAENARADGDLSITAAEEITVQSDAIATAAGGAAFTAETITARNGATIASGVEASGEFGDVAADIILTASDAVDVESSAEVKALGALSISAENNIVSDGVLASGAALTLYSATASGDLSVSLAGEVESGGALTLTADSYTLSGEVSGAESVDLTAETGVIAASAEVASLDQLNLSGASATVEGLVVAGEAMTIDLTNSLDVAASGIIASGDTLTVGDDDATITNAGVVTAEAAIDIAADTLTNDVGAEIAGDGAVTVAADTLTNAAEAEIVGDGAVTITATRVDNGGTIHSEVDLSVTAAEALDNAVTGSLQSIGGALTVTGLDLENRGLLASGGALTVRSNDLDNLGGAVLSQGDMTLEGLLGGLPASHILNEGGRIETLSGDLEVRADTFENISLADIVAETIEAEHQFSQSGPPRWVLELPSSFWGRWMSRAGFRQLSDGGRTRTHVFVPHPDELARILEETGQTLAEFGATGWRDHQPTSQETWDPNKWVLYVPDESVHAPGGSDVIVIENRSTLNGPITEAVVGTDNGGDAVFEVGTLTNRYGSIAIAGDLTINADTVNNEATELFRSISTRLNFGNDTVRSLGWDGWFAAGNPGPRLVSRTSEGSVPSTIAAGGSISGTAADQIVNQTLPDVPPSDLPFAETSSTVVNTTFSGDRPAPGVDAVSFNPSLFAPAPPDGLFVIETRAAFIDPSIFFGSQFFLERVGGEPSETIKSLGDAYFDTVTIRQQIVDRTGARFLTAGISDDREQMRELLLNAVAEAGRLDLAVGVALTEEQQLALTSDIVWYEEFVYLGQPVLIPRLYLAPNSRGTAAREGAVIAARGGVSLETGDMVIDNAALTAGGPLELTIDGKLLALGGAIAGDDVTIDADQVVLAGDSFRTGKGRSTIGTVVGRQSELSGQGDVGITTASLQLTGSELSADGDLDVTADTVSMTPTKVESLLTITGERVDATASSRSLVIPRIAVGGDGALTVRDTAFLQAAELEVSGDLVLRAGTFLIDSGSEETRGSGVMTSSGGFGGSSERTWNYLTITQIPSLIDVGGDVTLEATDGNGVIRASTVAGELVSISAEAGAVRFEGAYDTDFYQETKTGENFAFTSASDKGREERVLVASRIDARETLEVTARDGIVVQYPAGLDLDGTIEVFGDTPALAWMQTLRARDDVDWQAMNEVYREWDHESFGLSGPAAAVVSIAVTVATKGWGAQFATGTLGLAQGSAAALAAQAGFTTLVSQAAVSLINNQGDLGAVLSDLGSSANLRQLATAIVSTGLSDALGLESALTGDLFEQLQQQLLNSAFSAGIDVATTGGDLGEALRSSLQSAVVSVVGAQAARQIGALARAGDIPEFSRYVAHAALGCAYGGLSGGSCGPSAVGALAGEIAAEIYLSDGRQVAVGEAEQAKIGTVIDGEVYTRKDAERAIATWANGAIEVGGLTAALAAFAAGEDSAAGIYAAQGAGSNAVENNLLCGGLCLGAVAATALSVAYAGFVGQGDIIGGVDVILAGEDPASQALATAIEWGVEEAYAIDPDSTTAVLNTLAAAGETVDVVLHRFDEATNKVVSTTWNSLDETTRKNLSRTGFFLSAPAGVLAGAGLAKAGAVTVNAAKNASGKIFAKLTPRGDTGGRGPDVEPPNTGPRFITDAAGNTIDTNATKHLTALSPLDVDFQAGRGGTTYAMTAKPNSYANLGNGHAVVYGANGRALYDVSAGRVKVIEWNRNPSTGQWFPKTNSDLKAFEGNVPQSLLDDLGLN